MRNLILPLILIGIFAPASFAQDPPKTTYFLIDASGSMAKLDAEAEVKKRLDPIKIKDGKALVSRTYFRAETPEACRAPVKITEPVPATESVPERIDYRKDDTPLGEALKAAILDATRRGGSARIYLISDDEQTPGCGVDVCTVASALLPIENIIVERVPVLGANSINSDRLGCIEAAQANRGTRGAGGGEGSTGPTPYSFDWFVEGGVRFLEYWLWFFGFAFLAGWAIAFGYRHLHKSVQVENQIRDIHLARDKILLGDKTAGPHFDAMIQEHKQAAVNEANEEAKHPIRRWLSRRWPLVIGLLILIPLAVVPDVEVGIWSFARAKEAAWRVSDSAFAAAFATIWIAIVFFAGSQLQRENAAKRTYEFATDEARQVRVSKAIGDYDSAYGAYMKSREVIAKLDFTPDAPIADGPDEFAAFKRVVEAAKKLPLLTIIPPGDSIDAIEHETDHLTNLAEDPKIMMGLMSRRLKFAEFVERLVADPLISTEGTDWSGLAEKLAREDSSERSKKIRELDKALNLGD